MPTKLYFKHLIIVILIAGCFVGISSCNKDGNESPSGCSDSTTYVLSIKKIIDRSCSGAECHANNVETFDFTTYEGTKEAIGSFKNRLNRHKDDPLYMPKGSQLSACDLERLSIWIDRGAPRN
jgi:hypothetical protein